MSNASDTRSKRILDQLLLWLSLALMAFVVYTSATSPLSPMLQRSLILLAVSLITILTKPLKGVAGKIVDGVLTVICLLSIGYIAINWEALAYRVSYASVWYEVLLGAALILALLELTRRCIGWPLIIIALVAILYVLLGRYLPSAIAHKGYSLDRLITNQYITNAGIWGTMVGTLSTVIAPFVLFGAVLQEVGTGELMVDIAQMASGNSRGGPAKMAVVASGLFGMVSGSSTSNVMTTGCTTIPLMKKTGYEANFAGAVEAAASTGGQFMPPVMGVAAFLMSYVTGIPYIKIAVAAVIPALFYFISIFVEVDLEARRIGLKPMNVHVDKALVLSVLKRSYLLLPFIVLVVLLMQNWSCAKAAFYSTALTLILGCIKKESRISWPLIKRIALNFGKSMTTVGMACAVAGIIIGALNLTGATLRLTYAFVGLANGRLLILLACVAILCIILGMGLPTPAAYSVAASFAAPALMQVGVSTLASHLFVLYYASLSSITPPVALAAYAAASLSGGSPMKTGWTAWRIALVGFLVPFMFVYGPALLIGETPVADTLLAAVTGLIGIAMMGMVVIGYLNGKLSIVDRSLLFIASLCMIYPGLLTDLIGLAIGGAVIALHILRTKKKNEGQPAAA